ncbi:aromatic ring-hydroxylating dioxygenase subunit alpha [Rahnella sp. SAP-1]|uniref:Aromatic ring-hydroxylating dioxygenase subunit alpha n=1 Tax=Rouxiella aceris TaxID=2703884 RepID=A0A848ME02_9GAMM|nr:aromatic ring-hydroxylating dioxygenase subunit alpha [Rouxiella aceris]NMP26508.1 aromatic ring-hydroxylating dioxygenase subunit alpha [Rouxiella aceris]
MLDVSRKIDCVVDEGQAIAESIIAQQSTHAGQATTLPPQAYHSESFFQLEKEKIFRQDWLFIGHISQIPQVGDYFSIDIIDEPLLCTRSEEGIRVMSRVCLHRWVPIVEGSGNAKVLVCPFHNWSYNIQGQLVGAPQMNQAEDFDRKSCQLPQIRSEIVAGMIFITFSAEVEPLATRLAPVLPLFEKYHFAELQTAYPLDYDCPFNWKMAVETFMECYHHSAVHRTTLEDSFPGRLSYIGEDGPGWTFCHQPLRKNGDISEVLTAGLLPFAGMSEEDLRRIDLMLIYPFCLIGLNPDRISISTLLPLNSAMTQWHRLVLVSRESMQQEGFADTAEMMKNSSTAIIAEDLEINSLQRRGSRSQLARPGRLGHLEKTVWHLANYIKSKLR